MAPGSSTPAPGVSEGQWVADRANYFETVFTVGNGRLGTRGSLEERHQGALPGTFIAGVYDAHDAAVTDLVNCPDWLLTTVRVDGVRLDVDTMDVVEHRRTLDLATGVLHRSTTFCDAAGRRTRLATRRLVSMADRDLAALQVEVTTLGHAGEVTITTGLDAHRRNLESMPAYREGTTFPQARKWEKWSRSTHLSEVDRGFTDDIGHVVCRTAQSGIDLAFAYSLTCERRPEFRRQLQHHEFVGEELTFTGVADASIRVDKFVGIATSRDPGSRSGPATPVQRARKTSSWARTCGIEAVLADHTETWDRLWDVSGCTISGDERAALALRFSVYQLLIAANPDDPTVNIGAKSLSGEGYRGHVFWDTEIMMLPFYLHTQQRTARALLSYRHHTLPGAREVSRDSGTRGARYPWESADSGREECPITTPDGTYRFFTRDQEIHVSADVAFGMVAYADATGDTEFLHQVGAEVLFETSRFWADRCESDGDRLVIRRVMGPDEFHSGVDNNLFTNYLAAWHLRTASALYESMSREAPAALADVSERIGLAVDEPSRWADVAAGIALPVGADPGLLEQFDGYFERSDVPIEELDGNDMPQYPRGYHHFNCEDTQLLKQPDVLMVPFLFPDAFALATQRANYDYYEARTLHKSSLSPAIHAIVGLQVGDASKAERYFARSAFVDLDDNQGNTDEGIHIASAGGTWQVAVLGFGGLRLRGEVLHLTPQLPDSWERLTFSICRPAGIVRVDLGHLQHRFTWEGEPGTTVSLCVEGTSFDLSAGDRLTVAASSR